MELQSLWREKREEKPKQNQSELKRCQKRYDELSALIRSLYENLMAGLLPERQYKQLMAQYDSEQAELESKMETMKSEIAEDRSSSVDIQHFISLIRKCKNPTEISDSMFNELVDKIVVYEAEGAGNARTQKVDIYFNYVGQVDIAYTEEELAELKAQKEQEERQRLEKQRKREKAYREKRKAKKIAENGGEIIKTKTCPHCGKVFTPTSNRQLFCSRECWNQAMHSSRSFILMLYTGIITLIKFSTIKIKFSPFQAHHQNNIIIRITIFLSQILCIHHALFGRCTTNMPYFLLRLNTPKAYTQHLSPMRFL